PDGVAEVWSLDIGPTEARGWSDWLAAAIADRFADHRELRLSVAVPHPSPGDYDIERFTHVAPRPIDARMEPDAVITYPCRNTRSWRPRDSGWSESRALIRLVRRLRRRLGNVDF